MDTSAIRAFDSIEPYYNSVFKGIDSEDNGTGETFEALLDAAVNMVNETNAYTDAAEKTEIAFALGDIKSTTELQTAQLKANISLQYTIAVRNAVMDAYREIMQISF